MAIEAGQMDFKELNHLIKTSGKKVEVSGVVGQRFIASGAPKVDITINGTPGNALASYLNGATITVNGNVQDAVGDTMNEGKLIVHGNAGDALGYAMRGGEIYIKGYSGYRTGIHMKQYKEKRPVIVVGDTSGCFLGEYLAGGMIIVLNLNNSDVPVGDFSGTGMHGGKIFVRANEIKAILPKQVAVTKASPEELEEIRPYVKNYSDYYEADFESIMKDEFLVLKPNAKNPYKKLYVAN